MPINIGQLIYNLMIVYANSFYIFFIFYLINQRKEWPEKKENEG